MTTCRVQAPGAVLDNEPHWCYFGAQDLKPMLTTGRPIDTIDSSVAAQIDEMRSQHLNVLLLCSLLPWSIALMRTAGWLGSPQPLHAWPVTAAFGLGLLITYWLQNKHSRIAAWAFIVTLISATVLEASAFPDGPALYFFVVVGVVAALLRSERGAAAALGLMVAGIAITVVTVTPAVPFGAVLWPALVAIVTGLTAWLGTHRLGTVLRWYQQTTRQAVDAAHEAQTHRAELMRLNKELDGAYLRLERMNNMLVLARKEAEDAKMLKVQFANAVSHELRSPINLVIGFSDMMMNAPEVYEGQVWSPRLKNHIAQINQSSQHLSQLIDDVLDMSRIDAYRLSLVKERTPVAQVIAEAYEIVHSLFEARNLYLRVEVAQDLPMVMLDHTRIRQVLLNLLTNAVRFTTEGGVTIRAVLDTRAAAGPAQDAPRVVVSVCDTGIGIEQADLPKLFQVFCQLEGAYRWNRGSGLGLSISKQLVELHGGSIWADSEVGAGTAFSFSLPVDADFAISNAGLAQTGQADDPYWNYLERRAREHTSLVAISDEPNARRLLTGRANTYDITWLPASSSVAEIQRTVASVRPTALIVVNGAATPPGLSAALLEHLDGMPIISLELPGLGRPALPPALCDYLIKPVSRRKLADAISRLERSGADAVRRVLVVEDEAAMREFLALALRNILGAACVIADVDNGQAALERIAEAQPDLMLVDLNLPDIDGMALAAIAAERSHGQISIIAVTARDLHLQEAEITPDVITCTRGNHFSQHELEGMLAAMVAGFSPGVALADAGLKPQA